MNKRILGGLAAATMLAGGLALITSGTASATPSEEVTICHATASQKNPYITLTVDTSSADEANNGAADGHGDHDGPVFPAAKWGDIIPPFETPDGYLFPGLNYTAAGQAIYDNGCEARQSIERPVLTASYNCALGSASATLTPATSDNWTAGDITKVTGENTFSVTITPAVGFFFTGADDSITLTAQYTVTSECEAIVAAPTLTAPSCLVDGSVVAVNTRDYTFGNVGNTYTATAVAGKRLVGQTVFVLNPAKAGGAGCATTTNTPNQDVAVAALPPIAPAVAPAQAVAPAAAVPTALPTTGIDGTGVTALIALLLTSLGGAALMVSRRNNVTN